MVWTQKHNRHSLLLVPIDIGLTSVISSIVKQQDSIISPIRIYLVHMVNQLQHEEIQSVTIGLAIVDCIVELTIATYTKDDVDPSQSTTPSLLVLSPGKPPTPSSIVCAVDI